MPRLSSTQGQTGGRQDTPPEPFFTAMNTLISKHADEFNISATVSNEEIIRTLVVDHDLPLIDVLRYLERIELLYRARGWDVHFERPGHDQSGIATYTFTKKQ